MTKIVGITGGIGSGKSTVCNIFESLGIPVYRADTEAKKLYNTSSELKAQLTNIFGAEIYQNDIFQPKVLASLVFGSEHKLNQLNNLVHPLVADHFHAWVERQKGAPYVMKEAAILLETGGHKDCFKVILVSAPEEIRIKRVVERDNTTPEQVKSRMQHQWTDDQRRSLVDYEVVNDGSQSLIEQAIEIHKNITQG